MILEKYVTATAPGGRGEYPQWLHLAVRDAHAIRHRFQSQRVKDAVDTAEKEAEAGA